MKIFGIEASGHDGSSPLCTIISKLQLQYSTTITQNCHKLRWMKSDNYNIKQHPSRLTVGGVQMRNSLLSHSCVVDKTSGGISREWGVPGLPTQGSSARNVSPHNFCCTDQQGLSQWNKLLEPQEVPLKKTHTWTDLLRLTPSGLRHRRGGLRGTSGMLGEAEGSGIKVSRGHCPFSRLSTHRATDWCST